MGALGTALDTISYGYGDSGWPDLLTSYDGQTLTSDTIGNLLSDGTWSCTWKHGRQLASMTSGTTTLKYNYSADGQRTEKSVYTTGQLTYQKQYIYADSMLACILYTGGSLYFIYDASGGLVSVNYNGTNYYYLKNAQGDIMGLTDTSGNVVVQYTYDAWGSILTTTGSLASTLGQLNPFRYRSYFYDRQTGLLSPEQVLCPAMGRFINADGQISDDSIFGSNLFTDCYNNPVMLVDFDGHIAL